MDCTLFEALFFFFFYCKERRVLIESPIPPPPPPPVTTAAVNRVWDEEVVVQQRKKKCSRWKERERERIEEEGGKSQVKVLRKVILEDCNCQETAKRQSLRTAPPTDHTIQYEIAETVGKQPKRLVRLFPCTSNVALAFSPSKQQQCLTTSPSLPHLSCSTERNKNPVLIFSH